MRAVERAGGALWSLGAASKTTAKFPAGIPRGAESFESGTLPGCSGGIIAKGTEKRGTFKRETFKRETFKRETFKRETRNAKRETRNNHEDDLTDRTDGTAGDAAGGAPTR